jgi:hypothetical protein
MRKEDHPAVTNEIMQGKAAVIRFNCEVGQCIVNA